MVAFSLSFTILYVVNVLKGLQCDFSIGIVTINNRHPVTLGSMPYSAGAMDLAVERVRQKYRDVFNVTHTYLTDDHARNCDGLTAVTSYLLSKYYYSQSNGFNITVAIFPGCSEQTEVINLTREWRILTILGATAAGGGGPFRDRDLYPHVVSAGYGNPVPYAMVQVALHLAYRWKNVYVAYDGSTSGAFLQQIGLGTVFLLKNYAIADVRSSSILCAKNQSFDAVLEDFKSHARVLAFYGHATCTRRLLVEAYKKQMINGEYVYMTQDVQKNTTLYGTLNWRNNDEDDKVAREAFQSLLTYGPIEAPPVSSFAAFNEEVKRRSRVDYNFTFPQGEQVNTVAKSLFNAVHLVAQVINASYQDYEAYQNRSVFDANSLALRFLGHIFYLPMGDMYIDKGGERAEAPGFFSYDPNATELSPTLFATIDQKGNLVELRKPAWPGPWPAPNTPVCGYQGNEGPCASRTRLNTIIIAAATGTACAICLVGAVVAFRRVRRQMLMRDYWWKLDGALVALEVDEVYGQERYPGASSPAGALWELHTTVYYRNKCVHLRTVPGTNHDVANRTVQLSAFLLKLRPLLHTNVNPFIGILSSNTMIRFVEEHCSRGDLRHFYKVGSKMDNFTFRRGLAADLLTGLKFIHESGVKYHGDLQPRRCLLDGRFTLKITGAGYDRLVHILSHPCGGDNLNPFHEFSEWTAPENWKKRKTGTPQADVYAVGLILQQLIADFGDGKKKFPSNHQHNVTELKFCSLSAKTGNAAAAPSDGFPEEAKQLFKECLSEIPEIRPTTATLLRRYVRAVDHEKTSAVGHALKRLGRYASDLEDSVAARTHQLLMEQTKCDTLLCEMLPRSVVNTLRRGEQPTPEWFDGATVSFTGISGFAEIVLAVSPEQVITFLTNAHGLFDGIVLHHDVYKVESIGDSYMTASGLPVRNEKRHAQEICQMAIQFLRAFPEAFRAVQAACRIGVHTGPCIAAVVGSKRPRYCLFGDTINTASRMESHGDSGKTQISSATAALLKPDGGITATLRGTIHVKGKGEMTTFWLDMGI